MHFWVLDSANGADGNRGSSGSDSDGSNGERDAGGFSPFIWKSHTRHKSMNNFSAVKMTEEN